MCRSICEGFPFKLKHLISSPQIMGLMLTSVDMTGAYCLDMFGPHLCNHVDWLVLICIYETKPVDSPQPGISGVGLCAQASSKKNMALALEELDISIPVDRPGHCIWMHLVSI